MIRLLPAHLFRRHITHRPHHRTRISDLSLRRRVRVIGARSRLRLQLCQAEVENLDAAVAGDEQVLRLQVAMDDPFRVRRGQTCGDLPRVLNRLAQGSAPSLELRAQLLAFQQFGDDERRAIVRADVVNGQDVRMIERRGRARFLLEAAQPVSVFGERGGQNLDCDFAVEARVTRAVDFAHPARAELGDDTIV